MKKIFLKGIAVLLVLTFALTVLAEGEETVAASLEENSVASSENAAAKETVIPAEAAETEPVAIVAEAKDEVPVVVAEAAEVKPETVEAAEAESETSETTETTEAAPIELAIAETAEANALRREAAMPHSSISCGWM